MGLVQGTSFGKEKLREVGPADGADSQGVVSDSARDQLQGRMNFCREAEGTGSFGKMLGQ
jgi:hypothetical protein